MPLVNLLMAFTNALHKMREETEEIVTQILKKVIQIRDVPVSIENVVANMSRTKTSRPNVAAQNVAE